MKKGYNSTRSKDINVTASQGILQGLAPDGGLFVPNFIHQIQLDPSKFMGKSYGEMANVIFSAFLDDFNEKQIEDSIQGAYYSGKFEEKEPVTLEKVKDRYFLELFHGPTCAFKDMALTILPYLMVESMKNVNNQKKIMILTATSGDTGKAALEGLPTFPISALLSFTPRTASAPFRKNKCLPKSGQTPASWHRRQL